MQHARHQHLGVVCRGYLAMSAINYALHSDKLQCIAPASICVRLCLMVHVTMWFLGYQPTGVCGRGGEGVHASGQQAPALAVKVLLQQCGLCELIVVLCRQRRHIRRLYEALPSAPLTSNSPPALMTPLSRQVSCHCTHMYRCIQNPLWHCYPSTSLSRHFFGYLSCRPVFPIVHQETACLQGEV